MWYQLTILHCGFPLCCLHRKTKRGSIFYNKKPIRIRYLNKVIGRNLYIIIGLSLWPRGVADVDGLGSGADMHGLQAPSVDRRRAQTGCWRRRRRGGGLHGAWLTRRAGTSRQGRRRGGQTCKPTAQIEPKSRYWHVKIVSRKFTYFTFVWNSFQIMRKLLF